MDNTEIQLLLTTIKQLETALSSGLQNLEAQMSLKFQNLEDKMDRQKIEHDKDIERISCDSEKNIEELTKQIESLSKRIERIETAPAKEALSDKNKRKETLKTIVYTAIAIFIVGLCVTVGWMGINSKIQPPEIIKSAIKGG